MSNPGDIDAIPTPKYRSILTPRLHLRTLSIDDAEDSLDIVTRKEVMRWTSREALKDLEQTKRWLADRALGKECFNFAIELRLGTQDGGEEKFSKLIGMVGSFHHPGVGYMIHPDHAGNGYATEALRAVLPALWDYMPSSTNTEPGVVGYDYLEGLTDTENFASQKILQKCGFVYCETRLQDFYNPTLKEQRDTAFYRMPRPGLRLEGLGMAPVGQEGEEEDTKVVPPIQ